MRLLITGGAGFIGSTVIRHLLGRGDHAVINVDKLTYAANLDSLKAVLPNRRYIFEQVDIADRPRLAAVFARHDPDAVLHLAAESHVDRSIDAPAPFIETNIVGTYTLLECARAHWEALPPARRAKFRFLHVSSDEVFGSLGESGRFSEDAPYAPNSPYSASKASSDMLARAWHQTYGFPVVRSNCSNCYGPFQFPEKLIPLAILSAVEGAPIPIYGSGRHRRDWLFVSDHVEALLAILERGRVGETYNVGGNGDVANLDLVHRLCAILDDELPKSAHRPHACLITHVSDRPGHDQRYAIDARKLEAELGWRARVNLDSGLSRTVAWYLENRWWWKAIRARGFDGARPGLVRTGSQSREP